MSLPCCCSDSPTTKAEFVPASASSLLCVCAPLQSPEQQGSFPALEPNPTGFPLPNPTVFPLHSAHRALGVPQPLLWPPTAPELNSGILLSLLAGMRQSKKAQSTTEFLAFITKMGMITLIKMKKSFAHTVYMKNSKYKTHPKHSFVLLKKNEGGLIPVPSQATEAALPRPPIPTGLEQLAGSRTSLGSSPNPHNFTHSLMES